MLVRGLHIKIDAKQTNVNKISRTFFLKQAKKEQLITYRRKNAITESQAVEKICQKKKNPAITF